MMSQKERERKVFLEQVKQGYLTLKEAAVLMNISYRQAKRLYSGYRAQGDAALVHKRRGCVSNRAFPTAFKDQVLTRYRVTYEGFGPTLAAEKLAKEGYYLHPDTLRKWLLAAGLWQCQTKPLKHRKRRARKARFGELLQLDGSIHAWFGPCAWIARYGIPKALYVDLKNLYVGKIKLHDEALIQINQAFSVFANACQKLGIAIIKAYSPQAKGRVERSHQVYQDRLVKEIRLQ